VRFIRYEGTEEKTGAEMNVIKDVIFEGPVREQIDKSVAFLATQIKERTYLGPDGKFITEVEYPEFVRQEMIVNACCHRDLSITGTDIQVKLFDDRLVVESPGNLPGLVRPDNIRHTHFSRNPRLARYLKTYKYVKEFGEGVDRMCREMEADGLLPIKYYKNDFILRAVASSKNAKDTGSDKVAINSDKVLIKT
jgi:ATP-dependent DNA helicase RecG